MTLFRMFAAPPAGWQPALRPVLAGALALLLAACGAEPVSPDAALRSPDAPPSATAIANSGWSWTGPGTATVSSGLTVQDTLTYQLNVSGEEPLSTWIFSSTAPQTTQYLFDWSYSGFHGWFADWTRLVVWANTPLGRDSIVLVATPQCENCAGELDGPFGPFTGTQSLQVYDGLDWGFSVTGDNFDSGGALQGTILVTDASSTATVTGQVRDQVTNQPIAGAQVVLSNTGQGTLTNANGDYALVGIAPGSYTLTAQSLGYYPTSVNVSLLASTTQRHDFLLTAQAPQGHTLTVNVTGPGGALVPNVAVAATNVADGDEFYVECTNASGAATFQLPAASYVVHARNLPICDPALLQEWPYSDEVEVINTSNTDGVDRVGVVLEGANLTSLVLNPANYKAVVANDPLVLAPGSSTVGLQFGEGATVLCSLLNSSGQPFTMSYTEHFYSVQPFGDETGLPPISPSSNPNGLPRGIGTALATLPQGGQSDDCSISGLPAGEYVLETNYVLVTNDDGTTELAVYREPLTITESEASSGATIEVTAEPEPLRASTSYLSEPFGDSPAPMDLGLVTYGWGLTPDLLAVSDRFVVAADFEGLGHYTLELLPAGGAPITATAVCEAKGCKLVPRQPKAGLDRVEVSGTTVMRAGQGSGTVVWEVSIPGVQSVQFRVLAGQGKRRDTAPDSGLEAATRPASPNTGNSFNVIGE